MRRITSFAVKVCSEFGGLNVEVRLNHMQHCPFAYGQISGALNIRIGNIEINSFNGKDLIQIRLIDIRKA